MARLRSAVAVAGTTAALGVAGAFVPAAAATIPTAGPLTTRTVGPLFPSGVHGVHTCTASVVHSAKGNLLVTAAHCVSGTGTDITFAPGYHNGVTPYGVWRVAGDRCVRRLGVDPLPGPEA